MRTIELTGVTHRYGSVTALDGVDLHIEAGESVVVLGPSGCGKSTLLRLVAGLDQPTAGDIRFDGESQLHRLPHERDMAIVFQSYALYPHLTARENIALGLRHGLKLPVADVARRIDTEATRLGIEALLDRKPQAMSGGQRQRVALARALAKRSGILLLDEPLSGLDAQLRTTLRVEIAALLRAIGTTSLHVTHDQVDALTMADRIVVLRDGRIQQVGTPLELYRAPANWFVATFLGTPPMNRLPCRIEGHHLVVTGFGVVTGSGPATTHAGAPATSAGVRAEDLCVLPGGESPGGAPHGGAHLELDAIVRAVELHGSDWLVHADAEGVPLAARHAGAPPSAGARVRLRASADRIHLFADDGHRVGLLDARRVEQALVTSA